VATSLADDTDGRQARILAEAAGLDLTLTHSRPGPSGKTLILLDPRGERTIISLDGAPEQRPATPSPDEHPGVRPDAFFIRAAYEGAETWVNATNGPVLLHWPAPQYRGEADVVVTSADDLTADENSSPFAAAASRLGPRLKWVVVTHGQNGAVAHSADGR